MIERVEDARRDGLEEQWKELMCEAKRLGIPKELVRAFLRRRAEKVR